MKGFARRILILNLSLAPLSGLRLVVSMGSSAAFAAPRPIDTVRSKITVHVGKAGLFSAAGHEHEVSAPIAEGAIDEVSGNIWFRVEAAKLTVFPEKDQAQVQSTMQQSLLESAKFAEIRFESVSIRNIDIARWTVTGNLTLHGNTRRISLKCISIPAYVGAAIFRQTQFGIRPVSVAGGAVKVKDEVKIDFAIVPGK